ncbi:hypothetical protein ACHAWC_006360 [Mediolabrus comicus]
MNHHHITMKKGKSDDSAAAVAFDYDHKTLEKNASAGSASVASDRFEARMYKKISTGSASAVGSSPVASDRFEARMYKKMSTGSASAAGSSVASIFEARMHEKIMSGSSTQSAADGKDVVATSQEQMTQEENSRMHVELIDDNDVDAPMPLQMMDVMMEEQDEDEERYQRKINQEQTATSSNAQQLPLVRPPPQSILRHDTTPEAEFSSHELYAVTAELVEESGRSSTEHRSFDEEVYEAIVVPPKWKEYKLIIVAGLLIVVVVIVLGVVLGTREQTPTIKDTVPPTMQPTHDCVVRYDGDLTKDCPFCSIAFDGESGILALNYYNRIQFLSHKNQTVEAVSSNPVDIKFGPASISGEVAVLGVDSSGVHVFERDVNNTDTWTEVEFLLPDDCPEGEADAVLEDDVCSKKARFGFSVDVDGNIIVVGASNVIDVTGAVYVYRRNDTMWVKEAKFESSKEIDRFGRDVSVRQDRIAVASKGSVTLYDFVPTSKLWIQAGVPIVNEECASSEYWFGYSIALVGTHGLLIGCPSAGNNSVGTVHYYTRDPSTGEYIEQQIVSPFDQTVKRFGSRLSVDANGENVVAISTEEKRKGSVFLFTLVEDKWVERARIRSPDDGIKSFGGDIAVSGGRVIVSSESNVHSYFLNCI